MKYLRPLILKDSLYTPIEKIINRIFEEVLFAPIRVAMRDSGVEITNARTESLERAIIDGKIYVEKNDIYQRFYGKFSAATSKQLKALGAKFDQRTGAWTLSAGVALPAQVQLALAHADVRAQAAVDGVIKVLDGIHLEDMRTPEELKEQYGKAVWRINEDFLKAVEGIAIPPELTEHTQQVISKQWAQNLDLYIKGWMKDAIFDLREEVQAHAYRGGRAAGLVKSIQRTHNVSKEKAKFLARQETSLLMSKLREERYKDIGVVRYRWQGVDDARERPDHKALNGKIYAWAQPPVSDRATDARNNPGEDFNCLPGQTKIISSVLPEKLYRRRYAGKTTTLITDSGESLTITPNHPVLTNKGWIAANAVEIGDNLIHVTDKIFIAPESNPNDGIASFEQHFSFFNILFSRERATTGFKNFHGDDGIDNEVDVITVKRHLLDYIMPGIDKAALNNIFSEADKFFDSSFGTSNHNFMTLFPRMRLAPYSIVRGLSQAHLFLFTCFSHTSEHTFAAIAWINSIAREVLVDCCASDIIAQSQSLDAFTPPVTLYRLLFWEILCIVCDAMMADKLITIPPQLSTQGIGMETKPLSDFSDIQAFDVKLLCVKQKVISEFKGHVYNLQNKNNCYLASNFIVHNCRCLAIPILDD